MKKFSIILLVALMALLIVSCGKKAETTVATDKSISLWTYPIGGWGDEAQVKALTDAFTAETGIKVEVQYLTYTDGDDKVNTAIAAKQAPDLIMEGPERLVANWGAKGYMVDMSDLLDAGDRAELNPATLNACLTSGGKLYEYPLVMTAHCMAINLDAFKAAGADKYVDLKTRTWTTENFVKAVDALYKYYKAPVGAVFCGGQGGDQGTRVLVNSLYGGTFTNAAHTQYTWDSPENVQALELLYQMPGIVYDPAIVGGDEINLFRNGTFKMAFCWNIAQQLNGAKTDAGEEIVFMSFPAKNGVAQLNGGIWGFGIFDNGNAEKIAWAKQFVKFMCDGPKTAEAVKTAQYFAVRNTADGKDISKIWADNATMNEYNILMQYLGDYYQVTKGWATARTCWWNMLQAVGAGNNVAASVAKFAADATAAAAAEK